MILTQTLALLVDAYRELNARKLFWITLVLSGLVVAAFAAFGINEKGLTFLHWQMDTPFLTTDLIPPEKFYKFAFANVGIPYWLTWGAAILALISTASLFPDFIAGGAIELTLSRPISRLRLFFTKYLTGLLFVGLQVLAFTLACFLVIGIRGNSWEFSLFLAVPIVVLFFSYLYCVSTLVGIVTRSTIAAVLVTVLFWLVIFGINMTDGIFLMQRETAIINVERSQRRVDNAEQVARRSLEQLRAQGQPTPSEAGTIPPGRDELEIVNPMLPGIRKEAQEAVERAERWKRWTRLGVTIKTVLPKTSETSALLDRWLLSAEDKQLFAGPGDESSSSDENVRFGEADSEVGKRMEAAIRGRTVSWIIGTSLLFQAVVLGLAATLFCRRDF